MRKKTYRLRQNRRTPRRIYTRAVWFVLLCCACAVFILSATMLALHYGQGSREEQEFKQLAALVADHTAPPPAPTPATALPAQMPQEPAMLERYQQLHEQNADMAGWIRIDGTQIDYPVMYTGDDFYLSHGFNKEESKSGTPFIDKRCTLLPFGTNTIIYGHHMKNGTMFAELERYQDESYYQDHPTIQFDTLYEQREYEIIAVFESQI